MDFKVKSWSIIVHGLAVISCVASRHHQHRYYENMAGGYAERAVNYQDLRGFEPSYQLQAYRLVNAGQQANEGPILPIQNPQQYYQDSSEESDEGPQQVYRSLPQVQSVSIPPDYYDPRTPNVGFRQIYGQQAAREYEQPPFHQGGQPPYYTGPQILPGVSNGHEHEATRNAGKFESMTITPEIEELLRKGLEQMKYDPKNIRVETVKKQVAGRGVGLYRASYSNPVWNQMCFVQFAPCQTCLGGVNAWAPVCNTACPGRVCKVDKRLRHSSSYDNKYHKRWSTKDFEEDRDEHRRDYKGADTIDDVYA